MRPILKEMGVDLRRISDQKFAYNPDFAIRWGNAFLDLPDKNIPCMNSKAAVNQAINKRTMANILSQSSQVTFPLTYIDARTIPDDIPGVYVRGNTNRIAFKDKSELPSSFMYATKPIDKEREFRVHVFQNEVIGVFEKIPKDPDTRMWRRDTCEIKKFENSDADNHVYRSVCKSAVRALGELGLHFGGVDIGVERETNNCYVFEVNSAPALNEESVKVWGDLFIQNIEARVRDLVPEQLAYFAKEKKGQKGEGKAPAKVKEGSVMDRFLRPSLVPFKFKV
jgi:hypothetical protein